MHFNSRLNNLEERIYNLQNILRYDVTQIEKYIYRCLNDWCMHRIVLKLKVSYCTKKNISPFHSTPFEIFHRLIVLICSWIRVTNRNKRKAGRNEKKKKKGRKSEITLHWWKIFTIIVDGCWYTKDYDTRIQNRVRNWYQSQRLNRQQYLECSLLAESYAITIHCLSTHCERLTMWNSGHEAAMMPHAPPANHIKPTEC